MMKVENKQVTTSSISSATCVADMIGDAQTPELSAAKQKRGKPRTHKTITAAQEKLLKNRRKQAKILNLIEKRSQKQKGSINE